MAFRNIRTKSEKKIKKKRKEHYSYWIKKEKKRKEIKAS